MSNVDHITRALEKNGLYAGNVILELIPDSKGVKPSIKVNNLATADEINNALENFQYLCEEIHKNLRSVHLPITYEAEIEYKESKAKNKGKEGSSEHVV